MKPLILAALLQAHKDSAPIEINWGHPWLLDVIALAIVAVVIYKLIAKKKN